MHNNKNNINSGLGSSKASILHLVSSCTSTLQRCITTREHLQPIWENPNQHSLLHETSIKSLPRWFRRIHLMIFCRHERIPACNSLWYMYTIECYLALAWHERIPACYLLPEPWISASLILGAEVISELHTLSLSLE